MEGSIDSDYAFKKGSNGFTHYFKIFDDKILRPILIYKYRGVENRPIFEIADVLEEYQRIETELRDGMVTVDDDNSTEVGRDVSIKSYSKSVSPMSSSFNRRLLRNRHKSVMSGGAKGGILEQYYNAKSKADDGVNLKSPKQADIRTFGTHLSNINASLVSPYVDAIPEEDPMTNRESIRGIE